MLRSITSHAKASDRIKVVNPLSREVKPVKIRIQNLTKTFGTRDRIFTAVDDVSLEIQAGTFFMIVGPSGCG